MTTIESSGLTLAFTDAGNGGHVSKITDELVDADYRKPAR